MIRLTHRSREGRFVDKVPWLIKCKSRQCFMGITGFSNVYKESGSIIMREDGTWMMDIKYEAGGSSLYQVRS